MEELRSTAILDREIQDDARRKAEKILRTCETECRKIIEDVDGRISVVTAQKKNEYANRLDSYIKDSDSAIPLEKQRRLVTFIDQSVHTALDRWFSDIGKEERLSLISRLLERYAPYLSGKTLTVAYIGYPRDAVQQIVTRILVNSTITTIIELSLTQAQAAGFVDGLIISSADRKIKCRATLAEIQTDLLSNKRQELAEALFCGRLPE